MLNLFYLFIIFVLNLFITPSLYAQNVSDPSLQMTKRSGFNEVALLYDLDRDFDDYRGVSPDKVSSACRKTFASTWPKLNRSRKVVASVREYCQCVASPFIRLWNESDDMGDRQYYRTLNHIAINCSQPKQVVKVKKPVVKKKVVKLKKVKVKKAPSKNTFMGRLVRIPKKDKVRIASLCKGIAECQSTLTAEYLTTSLYGKLSNHIIKAQGFKATNKEVRLLSEMIDAKGGIKLAKKSETDTLKKEILSWKVRQYLFNKYAGVVVTGEKSWPLISFTPLSKSELVPAGAITAAFKDIQNKKLLTFAEPNVEKYFWRALRGLNNTGKRAREPSFKQPWWVVYKKSALAKVYGKILYPTSSLRKQAELYAKNELIEMMMVQFIKAKHINATSKEIAEYVKVLPKRTRVNAIIKHKIAEQIISCKAIDSLYKTYGGKIGKIYYDGVASINPVGAMKTYFQKLQSQKKVVFYDKQFESDFWAFLDNPITVFKPKKAKNFSFCA